MISLGFDGNIVHNVSVMGGCNRNLKAILILIEIWTEEQIGGKYEIQT